jgi:hypothetical protein
MKSHGKLVYIYAGKKTVLLENLPFPLLQRERQRLKMLPQYQKGQLKIQYNFT